MASDHQVGKQTTNREQEALKALREHRAKSGYVPWNHADNDRLARLDEQQKQQHRQQAELAAGEPYLPRAVVAVKPYTALSEAIDQVAAQITVLEPPAPETETPQIWVDPELGRLAVGLKRAGEFRLWITARQAFGQPGWTTRDQLFSILKATGIITHRRSLNRLLIKGRDLFWRLAGDRVYLVGYVKLAKALTELARAENPDLVATNIPGVRSVRLDLAGDLGDFKAQVYAGWLTHRESPKIARATLCKLFAVVPDTLRNWEDRLGGELEKVSNFGQTSQHPLTNDRIADFIPEHSYSYVTRRGEIRIRWRQPNTYKTKNIPQKQAKGQSRKARFQAAKVAWFQPVEICAHNPQLREKIPFDRSHRESKRYFPTAQTLQKFLDRLERQGIAGIDPETPRYIYRGEDRYSHGIWEISLTGEAETTAGERLTIKREYAWWAGFQANQLLATAS